MYPYLRLPRLSEMAAPLSSSNPPGENMDLHLRTARAVLPQTLVGSQANYEKQIKITIYVYMIMISYENYSTLNVY